jgi:hypothetical protein
VKKITKFTKSTYRGFVACRRTWVPQVNPVALPPGRAMLGSESRMPEIGTSGSTSGDGKRSVESRGTDARSCDAAFAKRLAATVTPPSLFGWPRLARLLRRT